LDIEDKEFIIFVGPSGCGKSTTLRMIAGLEEISEGELYIGDRLVNGVPPKDRNIAMVFQSYALYPHLSVFKNIGFSLKLSKVPKDIIKEKVTEVAKILDIEHLLSRKPKALSGGERQRVALGRAMVRNPAVFLLDEPLSNLDAKLRSTMRFELIKLQKRLGTTFIYVTHDQVEAMTMGDKIVVMNEGFIQQVDTPQQLYDNPCNLFVAGFIGTPPMNFIEGQVTKKDEKYSITVGDFTLPVPEERVSYENLSGYEGKTVIVGVRPENLHIEESFLDLPTSGVIDTRVDIAEMMGSEILLYSSVNQSSIVSKIAVTNNLKTGDMVKLAVDCKKIHIFDKETEKVVK
jgi:multiple sugar transport system ATP-binding protein